MVSYLSLLQPLELLWDSLEEWLRILQTELNQINNPAVSLETETTVTAGSNSGTDKKMLLDASNEHGVTEDSTNLCHQDDLSCLEATSVKANTVNTDSLLHVNASRLSTLSEGEDTDEIFTKIAPRISAVIQAFYMCCACQHLQQ